jgi:hypothetical protein
MNKSIGALLIFGLTATMAAADPELRIENSEFDFGMVPHGAEVMQHFWFKSIGTDTLRIIEVTTKTDDSRIVIERKSLVPGDSMLVAYYWETGSKSGPISEYASIHTNSMAPRPERVILRATNMSRPDFIQPVTVTPFRFELARISDVSIDSIEFALNNTSERDLELQTVSFPVEECELVLPDSVRAYSQEFGYIKVYPEYLDTEFVRSVTLELTTGEKYTKRLTIPIRRKIFDR